MFRSAPEPVRKRKTSWSLAAMLAFGASSLALALPALALDFDTARCERSSDLKHWRCQVTCASGEAGIASCPSHSEWGTCGRQALHQACGISDATPAAACQRKVVLAGQDPDALKSACEASFESFDQILEGPIETFPGLAYRPSR